MFQYHCQFAYNSSIFLVVTFVPDQEPVFSALVATFAVAGSTYPPVMSAIKGLNDIGDFYFIHHRNEYVKAGGL